MRLSNPEAKGCVGNLVFLAFPVAAEVPHQRSKTTARSRHLLLMIRSSLHPLPVTEPPISPIAADDLTPMEEDSSQSGSSNHLRGAIVLTAALISVSHSIRVFGAKWQLIRARLEELGAGLRAAEAWRAEMDATVVEILATLYECDELARRCLEASYSGKLLMQSDLDVAASKLDRHGKRLSGVVKGRSFGGRVDAIVVSRPGVGACKDDMRFYVNDLMTRLKVGDKAMRKQALVALREAVAAEEDGARYVNVLVEVNGVLTVLVNCLDSSEVEIQEECAKVLSFVAGFRFCKCGLVSSGIIAPLIRVVEGGSEAAKEASARCLMKLTANMDNAWAVSAHNGVSVLMGVCQNGSSGGELIGLACGVLKNLVGVDEIKRFMIERGAIAVLIRLCRSREEASQIGSIELLQALADGDEATRQVVVAEGGIRALVRATEPKSLSSLKCREVAIRAIDKLCFSSASATSLLLSYGYMDQLLYFLRNGEVSIQELALKSVYRLSKTSDEARKAMGEAGFMPHVIKFLNAKSSEVQEMAAEALQMIVSVPKNLKRFAHDSHNIGLILQLLDPDESHNPGNRKFLLSILSAITSCNSGRRKIVNSGYVKNIEKLAQAEVKDAKRIVRKLSTNRFRSILTGIWHS